MFFKIHKYHITKGLHGALFDFKRGNFELKMAGPIWLPLEYNSILMLHKFSIWVCTILTYTWIRRMEQTMIVHQKGIAKIVIQLNIAQIASKVWVKGVTQDEESTNRKILNFAKR